PRSVSPWELPSERPSVQASPSASRWGRPWAPVSPWARRWGPGARSAWPWASGAAWGAPSAWGSPAALGAPAALASGSALGGGVGVGGGSGVAVGGGVGVAGVPAGLTVTATFGTGVPPTIALTGASDSQRFPVSPMPARTVYVAEGSMIPGS